MKEILEKYIDKYGTGFVLKTYNKGKINTYVTGYKEVKPEKKEMTETAVFDIASLTKTVTAILVHKSIEEGLLKLEDKISDINNNFVNLKEISIGDLLAHKVELYTDGYLGSAKTKEEFYRILYSVYVKTNKRTYVDVHYMILSNLLEKIYCLRFDEIVNEYICKPISLNNTSFEGKEHNNCVSCNYESRNGVIIDNTPPGIHHDTKARVAYGLGLYIGHSGIFTTSSDFFKILISLVDKNEKLLKSYTVENSLSHDDITKEQNEEIAKLGLELGIKTNDTNKIMNEIVGKENGSKYYNRITRVYNYLGTRHRNNVELINEIPRKASAETVVFTGYTGPFYLIDFEKEIIILLMANTTHDNNISRFEKLTLIKKITEEIYNNI
jgi:Beta-lactamase class C and other penicillin binding proteins